MPSIFSVIFRKYESNKYRDYRDVYGEVFDSIRGSFKLVFEIGVYTGSSLRGWREYFPNAHIVGIEIEEKRKFEEERITVEIGDATDRHFMEGLVKKHGKPDILIDDGGHFSSQIRMSHEIMFPLTTVCYVIEDYGSQYPSWAGGSFINTESPATDILHKHVDDLLSQYQHTEKGPLKSIAIYPSICFLFKKYKEEIRA